MKSFACTIAAVLLILPFLYSQHINDCATAAVVCTDENIEFNPVGPGFDDFADPDNYPGCIVDLEQNSAWYYFEIDPNAPPDLVLGFIIHPNGGYGEDYDWALFGPDVTCGDLGFPIRCSSSSFMCGFCPETGMGMGTTDFSEGPGTGDGFVATLVVQPGQSFFLMIDNWQGTSNGFVLEWTDTAADNLNCDAQPPCALGAIAGEDISTCEGETDIPLFGTSIGGHGNVSYSWSGTNGATGFLSDPNISNPTFSLPINFNGTIIYTLTVVEDTCIGKDSLEVTVNALPTITINQIGPFCENNPPQNLSAMPGGGDWGGAATGNTFDPMLNGPGIHEVTYSYTDINGCTNTSSIDIEVYAIPDVAIDPDPAEFCDSEAPLLLSATANGGAGGFSFHWMTPTGTSDEDTYNAEISGAHTVIVTDDNNCTNSATVVVVAHPNPDPAIVDPGPLCQSLEYIQLIGSPTGGLFDGSIITEDGEIFPSTTAPGTYSITYDYIDANGCEGMDILPVTIVAAPTAMASNNSPLCGGEQILLFGQAGGTGTVITYSWTGPNGYTSDLQNPMDATQAGSYLLVVSIDGCPSTADTTDVVLTLTVDAVASNGGPYCNGQPIQLFGSTNTSGSSITYTWTGPNGYSSDLQNPTDATQAGTYSLVVTIDGCNSPVSLTDVIFGTPPDGVASNSGSYCEGDTVHLFGNTTTSGTVITYTWNGPNGYVSNQQNPSGLLEPGSYQLIVNIDGCNSAPFFTNVIINALPQAVITGPASFCTGNSAILDAGAGYTGYLWSDNSTNPTLEVFSSGTYTVTVTDANGCTGGSSHSVTVTPSLSPVISGNLDFCEGSTTVLDAGPGFASYSWSTGDTTQMITVTDEGNFGVIVTDADGCSGSTNITTTINSNPNVMIGGSTTYCIGGYTVIDAGAGYASYLWSNDSTSQSITVTSPGIYSVDVVDQNGCTGSASVTIQESTSLSPVITGNPAFCENGSTTLNAGSGFASYLWSDNSGLQTLVVNTAGTYSVTVDDGHGCSGSSAVTVVEVLPPNAQLQTQASVCNTQAGGSILNLYDLILAGDMNGSWEDADNSGAIGLFDHLDFENIAAGDYHFKYTTNSATAPCPEATYIITITVIECACPAVSFDNASPLCNESGILDLTSIENTNEPGTWSLIQTPPGSNPASLNGTIINATGSDPGQYVFQFTLQNPPPPGCPPDFQVNVNVDPMVEAGISLPPVAYCANEDDLINLPDLITGENVNGTWTETSNVLSQGNAFNTANGTFKTDNQLPGTYTFEYKLTSVGACPDDSTQVSVIIHPLPIVMIDPPGTLDCKNAVLSLDANGSDSGANYNITWNGPGVIVDGNENSLHPTIDKPGNYSLLITNKQTGCSNTTSVTVIQNTDTPSGALINSEDPACLGDKNGYIQVDQVIGGTPPYLFSLDNAPFTSNPIFSQLPEGSYTLTLEDIIGCQWDTLIVLQGSSEIIFDAGPDISLEFGDTVLIQATTNLPQDQIDTVIWSPDDVFNCIDMFCLEGAVQTFSTITMSGTIVDINGCQVTDELVITVKKNRRIYIPNTFSPNDDGINDIFYISGSERQIRMIKSFAVYNRWGNVMHEAFDFLPNDQTYGWNGTYKDQKMNPDIFVYKAIVEYNDGVQEVLAGDVTLLK